MLFVRPAGLADIDALMDLAYLSGRGFTSLPEDRPTLTDRLELSEASFLGQVDDRAAWYTVMLENSETGQIEGVASVKGGVGISRPHYSFRVMTLSQYSSATQTRFDHNVLVLVNECGSCSEVGSLFLRPGKRQSGAGSLLARSRYMLIGAEKERFCDSIMSELRGWFDEADNSPFWEGISSKFFRLPFEEADRMITSTDGQFIPDLAPRHPIYLQLVDAAAREAIGKVHRHGMAALTMLEREGFSRSGLVDIFDGGPTMTCRRDDIRTVRETRRFSVRIADDAPQGDAQPAGAQQALVSTPYIAAFRAARMPVVIDGGTVVLPAAGAAILGVDTGAEVQVCI
ncbi:MAG: arginine N-succinyltransferase [Sphingobium sp.]|nr:arginine N-succinyltransferase [Sphingobium sp.]